MFHPSLPQITESHPPRWHGSAGTTWMDQDHLVPGCLRKMDGIDWCSCWRVHIWDGLGYKTQKEWWSWWWFIYIYIYIYHLPWPEFQVQNLRFWGKHVTVSTFCGNSHERPANIHWCRSLSINQGYVVTQPYHWLPSATPKHYERSRVGQRKPWQFRSCWRVC